MRSRRSHKAMTTAGGSSDDAEARECQRLRDSYQKLTEQNDSELSNLGNLTSQIQAHAHGAQQALAQVKIVQSQIPMKRSI